MQMFLTARSDQQSWNGTSTAKLNLEQKQEETGVLRPMLRDRVRSSTSQSSETVRSRARGASRVWCRADTAEERRAERRDGEKEGGREGKVRRENQEGGLREREGGGEREGEVNGRGPTALRTWGLAEVHAWLDLLSRLEASRMGFNLHEEGTETKSIRLKSERRTLTCNSMLGPAFRTIEATSKPKYQTTRKSNRSNRRPLW